MQNIELLKEQLQKEKVSSAPLDLSALSKKVLAVLEIIESVDVSEQSKNEALRTIISKIIYNKEASSLELYFIA